MPRWFHEMEDELVASGCVKHVRVGRAGCLLLEGKPFLDYLIDVLGRDPNHLLPADYAHSCVPV